MNIIITILNIAVVSAIFGITVAVLCGYSKIIKFFKEHTVMGIIISIMVGIAIGGVLGIQICLITIAFTIISKLWKK